MPQTTATEGDVRHLERALELAARARGQTSPNPMVGAVVVKEDRVIGEGVTQPPGESHAEVIALEAAAGNTSGATLYVSLEPCCHHGRTPPCTDAIVEAGIARVVIASDDPTPKAAGRGPGGSGPALGSRPALPPPGGGRPPPATPCRVRLGGPPAARLPARGGHRGRPAHGRHLARRFAHLGRNTRERRRRRDRGDRCKRGRARRQC